MGRSVISSNVFGATATSTNSKIIETKEKIKEMNQALSDLSESIARVDGRDETIRTLTGQYEAEKKIAETVERLFLEGYPDIASKMADDVREDMLKTKTLVGTLPKDEGRGVSWWYVIIGIIIGIIIGLVIGYLSFGKL